MCQWRDIANIMSEGSPHPTDKSWLDKIVHWFSSEPRSRSDLLTLLKVACQNEVIDTDVHTIIEGALHVADMQVRDIMIPRTQMTVIKAEQTLEMILPIIIKSAHSRYPVVGETIDDIQGILLAKDLLPRVLEKAATTFDMTPLLRPVTIVPESKRLNVLLREFRENRRHMAVVIDEYGGVAGLITIEDVLEQIVGNIEDEHDVEPDVLIKQLGDDDYLVKALTPIDEFNEQLQTHFDQGEFGTIGGVILQQFGRLPRRGEMVQINGFQCQVISADKRQIHLLRVKRVGVAPRTQPISSGQ